MGLLDGFISLARNINRASPEESETREGVASDFVDELSLDKSDEELIELAKKWEQNWNTSEAKKELERKQKENEKYWLGDHHTVAQKTAGNRDLVDNLIFEGLETALPAFTKQVAQPMVHSDETPEGRALAKKVEDRIADLADTMRLRLAVKKAVRHWSLYYIGIIKLGWSMKKNEITKQVKRPQQCILDADAITDECEYEGEYFGEYKTETAEDLIARFPAKTEFLTNEVKKKLGTKLRYIEWWTNDFLFWSYKSEILGKSKNPHWNYETTQTTPETVDEFGAVVPGSTQQVPGTNHFPSPKIPYAILSIFNLGTKPFDDTNPIEQSLPLQDVVNKRQRQIDKNADAQNGGAVVSGDAFTKEQAKQVADALRKGSTVWVPRGNVNNAYKRDQGAPLPAFVYQSLTDYRNELRNIFGTTGLSAPGIQSENTVRGKILTKAADTDRAAPVVDHIEQFYDYIFNWFVQLMMVHYTDPRAVARTQGSTTIVNTDFASPLVVSVKEGSLIPKDRLTQRNEAIDLWSAKAIDPITLFEKLEDPNPYETARRLFLWNTNPIALFPDLQQQAAALATANPPALPEGGAPREAPKVEPGNLLNEVPIQ